MSDKSGTVNKLPNGEYEIILTEGDAEVCITYVPDETKANSILQDWKAGTYRLLRE